MDPSPLDLDRLVALVHERDADDDALGQLREAVLVADELDDLGDQLIGRFVDAARAAGASWTEIGLCMGVSKQAAQKRFVAKASDDEEFSPSRFSRFTDRARAVVLRARDLAGDTGRSAIGPEHVLAALLADDDTLAVKALVAVGVDLAVARQAVDAAIAGTGRRRGLHLPRRDANPPAGGHIRWDARAKTLLKTTLREALLLGHNYIGTEHILLALLAEEGTEVSLLLQGLGADRARVDQALQAEFEAIAKRKRASRG